MSQPDPTGESPVTTASRSLATALWRARFASGLLPPSYTTTGDTIQLGKTRFLLRGDNAPSLALLPQEPGRRHNNFYSYRNNDNEDALPAFKKEETAMARRAANRESETSESAKQASTEQKKTISTAVATGDGSPAAAPQATAVSEQMELAGFQSGQFELLRAALDKRSEANASPRIIVSEFAALWLPVHIVDLELLAPALRQAGAPQAPSHTARVRKDLLNIILADLIRDEGSQEALDAKLDALSDAFDAYQKAAEQEREGLEEKEGDLGLRMRDRFDRLKGRFSDLEEVNGEAMDLLAPRSLSLSAPRQRSRMENDMPRYSSDTPERDEQGRFTSDNDRGSSRGRGGGDRDESGRFASEGRSSRRYDDDDNRSRGRDESGRFASERSRYNDEDDRSRGRDESGRFTSERSSRDDDRGSRGPSMSRSRYDDRDSDRRSASRSQDEDNRNEGRSRGGWFGDSEGHSEASRRGWESSDHGDSGWYGDREGHSEASRRGWQRSDHGESGWFGDSEGHSEASRRGWEEGHRSQRRDDEDGRRGSSSRQSDSEYRSRSRNDEDRHGEGGRSRRSDDDDDRRSSSGRGHGGWSGDPEGHSEASRRGWENRR